MKQTLPRIAAILVGVAGIAYIPAFFVVAATEHGHERVSWSSAQVIAGEAILPTLLMLAVAAVLVGLIALIAWGFSR